MPSGYTALLHDKPDATLEEFTMRCLRAMGVCVTMRDDDMNAPIPDKFEPSLYHANKLTELREREKELAATTEAMADVIAAGEYEEAEKYRIARLAEADALRERFQVMSVKVEDWTPPTPEHNGLKAFMLQQLAQELDFNMVDYYTKPTVKLTGKQWLEAQRVQLAKELVYHEENWQKDLIRNDERNAYLAAVRDSFKTPDVPTTVNPEAW